MFVQQIVDTNNKEKVILQTVYELIKEILRKLCAPALMSMT